MIKRGWLFRNRSFAVKFTLMSTIPVLIAALSISFFLIRSFERSLVDAQLDRITRNASLTALSMSSPYVIYNKSLLDGFVDSLSREKDILYVLVLDYNDRRILSHSNHAHDGEQVSSDSPGQQDGGQLRVTGTLAYEVVEYIRLGGELYGALKIGFDLKRVRREIVTMKWNMAGIVLATVLISVFISHLLARMMARPVLDLAVQAGRIAEGDLDVEIRYESGDAIGKLAASFQVMSRELQKRIGELSANENKYRALFEASNDAVLIIDQGVIVDYNRQALSLFRCGPEQIGGRGPDLFFPERQPDGGLSRVSMETLVHMTLDGRPQRADWRLSRLDGREFDSEISLSPTQIRDSLMIQMVIRDITERKEAEKEIELWNRTLEQRVQDRTRELEEAQKAMMALVDDLNASKVELEHSNREVEAQKARAESANRAKSEFLANMSHEIRTPMNAIVGLTYLVKQTGLTNHQFDYLTKIESAAQGLLGVINDILDFSKIEAGQLTMEAVPFFLDDVLDKVATVTAFKADEKSLELIFDSREDVPMELVGDPLRLAQVLVNLVGNAVKFTEKGEVLVHVGLIHKDDQAVRLEFSVKDSGIGMAPDHMNRLFKAFSQADASTTRKFGGTGLGLVISKRLVTMMGGDIKVSSEAGKGSTFSFTADFGRHEGKRSNLTLMADDFKDMRALVIDDSPTARKALKRILESFHMIVDVAESGRVALRMLEAGDRTGKNYDLILTDWRMPLMDGIETARLIKQRQKSSRIPVMIMVTAYGREEVLDKADRIGLDGFITKPVSPSSLLDSIMDAFGKGSVDKIPRVRDALNHDKGLDRIAGSRILLAEDNEVNQQVATELLQSVGLEVVCASHGGEVLELLESQPFDAVLMDIQMPVMDGFETTEAIRRREAEASSLAVPIIALTAHAMQGDREKSLQCGMSDHLTKPLDPEKLFECLVRWITPKNDQSLRQVAKRRKRSGRTTTAAAPTSLPGIDYARALARMGGKHDTFVRLARTFVDQQKDAALRIKTALDKGDTETARAICHSLKGVSGNLGAVDLSEAVDRLGKSIREEGPDAWSQALKQVDDHLDEVVRLFKTLEGETTTSGKLPDHGEQENSASLADALVEMRELIVGKNYRAGKQMSVLHDLARNTQTKKALDDLERCIRSFDFDGALVVTDALLNEEQTDSEDNHGQ